MRSISATVLLLISVAFAAAQNSKTKPDLGGSWKCVDAPKHSVLTGSTLVIVHDDPQIKMSRKLDAEQDVIEFVFYSDGRGETNNGMLKIKRDDRDKPWPASVTTWDGRKLTTKYSVLGEYREQPSGAMKWGTIETTDSWELSKDGTNLTQTRTVRIKTITGSHSTPPFNNPWGVMVSEIKYVYARQT